MLALFRPPLRADISMQESHVASPEPCICTGHPVGSTYRLKAHTLGWAQRRIVRRVLGLRHVHDGLLRDLPTHLARAVRAVSVLYSTGKKARYRMLSTINETSSLHG
jgi:hypothetical protein